MHKSLLANRLGRWLAVAGFGLLAAPAAQAQLAGPKAIPGDYATVAAAITALNTQGVGGGGVTFNIAAGYTETAANLVITATGTAANPIVFQKSGSGANPLITAGVGVSTSVDAVIALAGADYVTINGLDVAENAANITATTQMEFGYALARASATDGAQFNTIRNCVVTLNKTNTNTIGIAGLASTIANTTALPATSAAGANSGNKIYGNVVTNSLVGIYLAAGSATAVAFFDQNNEIGVTAGNTIGNFGGTVSGYGAGGAYQNGLRISGNTLNNTLNYASATTSTAVAASTVTSTLRGIYTPSSTSATIDITNNTLTLASGGTTAQLSGIENSSGGTAASNTITITGNTLSMSYLTATSATVYGIYNSVSPATIVISNNIINNTTLSNTGSTYLIDNNHSAAVATITGNQVSGVTRTGISGTMYGYYNNGSGAGTQSLTNNVYNNISVAGSSTFYGLYNTSSSSETQLWSGNQITNITAGTTPTGSLYGIYDTYGASGSQFFNNTVTGLSGGGTVYGLNLTNSGLAQAVAYGNTISGLSTSGGSSVYGIYTSVTTPTIYRNKVYGLSGSNAGSILYGIYTAGGTTITLHNNLVGDFQAPVATGLTAVNGLYFSSGTTVNAYFNTVYLNAASSGATFGTSGIYFTTTPTTVDLRNNVVVNKSTAAGTGGYTAALRRSSGTAATVPANLATTTNNNLYYAGTPSATNLIYVEGTTTATNAQQTLVGYKALVAARETNSVTEDVPFLSTTGSATAFLHVSPASPTQVEGGGTPITGITTDFDGDTRNATTPDIGADEGTFMPQDLSGPTITVAALGNSPSTTSRTITATITDASGIATGTNAPRLFFRKGTSGAFQSAPATSVSGSSYTFTFDYALVGGVVPGDVVQYYVVAQDASTNNNVSSNPPGGTFTTPPSQVYQYLIQTQLSGIYYVGTSTSPNPARTYATLTAAATAYNQNQLAGAVTFLLLDASYGTGETFPIQILNNADASANNTLTIKPNQGLTTVLTGSNAAALFQLIGSDYVTLDGSNGGTISATDLRPSRNWTINNTNTATTSNGIVVTVFNSGTDAATNNTFQNLVITGNGSATTQAGIIMLSTAAAMAANNNNKALNNAVSGSVYGIYSSGPSATLKNTGTIISQNDMTTTGALAIGRFGITALFEDGIQVAQNTIDGIAFAGTGDVWGISAGFTGISSSTFTGSEVTNATITRNYVGVVRQTGTYSAVGIALAAAASGTSTISNNMVAGVSSNGTSGDFGAGIFIGGGTGSTTRVAFNSVNMTGTQTGGNYPSFALAIGGTTPTVGIQNNILANTQSTGANSIALGFAYSSTTGAYVGLTSDHNDFFVGTGSTFAVGQTGSLSTSGVLRTTLAALNTETGQDAPTTSKNVDPQFVSATNLHTASVTLNNAGVPVSGITVDFDGETRNASTPDIGADEFTPLSFDLAAVALVAPATTSTCYGTAEPVSVSIRNAGTGTLDFSVTPATITVVVTLPGGGTTTLPLTLTTGTLASGVTQTVTLPGTLNMSTVGTYSFAITATVTGDGNTANDVLTPAPTRTVAAPVAGTLAPAASAICVSGTAALTLTGAANGSIQYQSSTDNVNFTDIAGATSAAYTTPVLTATTYFRAQVRCNTGTATSNVSTVTVSNPLVASANTPVSICAGSTATLTAAASAGSNVRFFSAATGGTALGSAGTYTTPTLTASTTYYAEAYSGSTEAVGKVTSAQTYGGYSGTATGLVFTTTGALTLQSATVFNATATAGSMSVDLVNNTTGAVITTVGPFAIPAGSTTTLIPTVLPLNLAVPGAGTYRLVTSSTPTPPTLYRDSGNNTFPYTSPSGAISITGGYIGSTSTSYYFFYNIQASTECVGAAARTAIQVNVTQPATASFPAATASTCGTSAYSLAGTVSGSATTGTYTSSGTGTFSPNATTLNATYTPSAADVAAGTVTITLTSAVSGTCPAATATLALSISPAPVATFSYPTATTYCAGSSSTVTPTLGTGATAGTFSSTTGLSIDPISGIIILSGSTAGTYTVTNMVAASGACAAATATTTVTIAPATSAAFAYATSTFCASGTNPTPSVTGTTGGTFSSTTGLSINATTGAINLSASALGTYTVTYTVSGACGTSATASVTITAAPVATFSYPTATTYCAGSTGTVTPTLGTGASAGVFSSTTGLTINATTGVITLATSTAGTYTVTNTIAASGACSAATATSTVTITPAASAAFTYPATTFCVSGTTAPAATVTGTTGGTFTSTTGLTLNATTGAITLASSTPGTYTVTYTVSGACGASSTRSVTITAAPVATFSYATSSACAGSATLLPATLGTGASAGTFTSTTGLTINATTGAVNPATSTAGTYTVTNSVAANGGCAAATSTATVTINALPATPTYTYIYPTPSTVLFTSSVAPAGTTYQWYLTTGTTTTAIAGATSQTYTANGATAPGSYTVRFINTATGCQSAASTPLTITATAQPLAGSSLTLFPNPTATGKLTLQLSGYSKAVQLTVLDALGRVVLTQKVAAGQSQAQLDLSGSATGVYLLRATTEGGTDMRRIVRE